MPRGVYVRKPEYLKKLSDAKKGKPSLRKGRKFGPLGDLHRERSRKAALGNKSKTGFNVTPETRKRLSESSIKYWKRILGDSHVPYTNGWRLHQKRLKQNGGFHSRGEWENLKAQYNWTCQLCRRQEPEVILTRDHIIPVLRGGSDNIENIQPLCRPCNSWKHTKEIK